MFDGTCIADCYSVFLYYYCSKDGLSNSLRTYWPKVALICVLYQQWIKRLAVSLRSLFWFIPLINHIYRNISDNAPPCLLSNSRSG